MRADDPTLTSHAGLLPVISFLTEQLHLGSRLRGVVGPAGRDRLHPVHLVLVVFVVAALAGVERMAHLECLRGDPVLLKFLRLARWPVRKVFARALELGDTARDRLVDLVGEYGLSTLPRDVPSVVVDIDSTAIVDNGEAEGSKFGYCGKGRRRRRHFPLVASVAETRAIIHTKYRDGSNITTDEMIAFIAEMLRRLRAHVGPACQITLRADAGIWCPRLGRWLEQQGVPFVMAIPLSAGVKLHLHTMAFEPIDDDGDIEFGVLAGPLIGLEPTFRIAVIRRCVHDPSRPPQGKNVEGHPHWRYQAVVSCHDWASEDLWRFYNGRADCERVFRVGKQALALGHLVSRTFRTNEVAFLLRALAFNADLRFQAHCEARARSEGRRVHRVGLEWRQPRFYRTAGRLVRQTGHLVLRVPMNALLADLWQFYAPDLVAPVATSEVATA